MSWQVHGHCHGDPRFTSTDPHDQIEAVGICGGCPVVAQCAEWARGEDFVGVAGGKRWRGKTTTSGSGNRPARFHHWNADDMRHAHSLWTSGSRTPWAVEGHLAYRAWRKRIVWKSRAAS
jgi:hypothetical protein